MVPVCGSVDWPCTLLFTRGRPGTCILPVLSHHLCIHTIWLEILAGRYFGRLLKICHLAEFTLAVEPVFSHNDIHNKMTDQTRWEFYCAVMAQLGRN